MERILNFLWPKKIRKKENIELKELPDKEISEDEISLGLQEIMNKLRSDLWKTQTIENVDGIKYIDPFESAFDYRCKRDLDRTVKLWSEEPDFKDNATSSRKRKSGNLIICPFIALDCHNESLRYAENALQNIRLAKGCGHFPQHLLPKLLQLEQNARTASGKEIENESLEIWAPRERMPVLSYIASKNHPCMADVVKIKLSEQYGRYMVSKYKIPAEKTILIEEEYLTTINIDKLRACSTCFAEDQNFIPCEHCTEAMFCNETCQNRNQIHEWECNTFITKIDFQIKIIIHSILLACEAFTTNGKTNVTELIGCIEGMLKSLNKFPKSTVDSKSKYQFFFKLASNVPAIGYNGVLIQLEALEQIYVIFSLLMKIPRIHAAFDSVEKRNFLKHLITHHCLVIDTNAFGDDRSQSLGLVESLFNHSCAPNIHHEQIGNEQYFYTAEKVKKGVQLFISYIDLNDSTKQRRRILKRGWGFICNCIICAPKELSLNDKCQLAIMTILHNRFDTEENTPEQTPEEPPQELL
ncbi:SET and MYND domain-containing protein DDB_G0273589-like isoform X2 [Contarinia nasturtii]|uniref:SET and MYND domain-containing protein DDB_G0273589-like isoform X2 n=1 Tax=Contarinia nasturtii TaxID=265458 RepID=UPI0012D498A4|nr:SET and MYND domain-containing protein DDB_G0273589-like isoform X2 [Contarinia nasturtii]